MHFYVWRPKETRLLEIVLLLTFAFRLFLSAIIFTFLQARNSEPGTIILATSVALIAVVIDLFFTIRSFWRCEKYKVVEWIGKIYKALIIGVALGYAVSIHLAIGYWGYTLFGFFVAFLFLLDYVLLHVSHEIEIPAKIKTTITPGTYVHYKGGRYTVIGAARHSETHEPMIVYSSTKKGLWVRPEHMFLEKVFVNGKFVPRFKKLKK